MVIIKVNMKKTRDQITDNLRTTLMKINHSINPQTRNMRKDKEDIKTTQKRELTTMMSTLKSKISKQVKKDKMSLERYKITFLQMKMTINNQVIELNKVNKEINGRNLTFVKGVIADETANIRYDFSQNEPLEEGLIYRFKNIMNSVDKNGYHYVTLGKYGTYHISRKVIYSSANLLMF